MNYILTVLLSLLFLTGFSQTQADLNREAAESYQKADQELNEVYQSILRIYQSDAGFRKSLKASQRIWISFRDAELKMKYPRTEPGYYRSIHPMCVSVYLEKLTRSRLATLKEWLDGVEEGDACGGSVGIKRK